MTSGLDVFLWVVVPYICLTVFVLGHVWRYRYDKFGWTTRSSQLYENRLLRLGSPLFHFGILFVLLGHVMGLGVPKSWTEAVGVPEGLYHFMAVSVGTVAGVCTVVGMVILIYRRRTVGPVFSATTRMDKAMYAVLATVIVLGLANTVVANVCRALRLPGGGVRLVPRDLPVLAAPRAHGRCADRVPAARAGRLRALRALAVHPAGPRLQRTAGLPDPAVHRLSQPRRPARQQEPQTWMGERQMSGHEHGTTTEEPLSLAELGSELLEQARTHHSRRAARTVSAGPSLRATVMALAAGADLAEHDPPPAATLQVLSGVVRLHAGDRSWTLAETDMVTIPQERHGLHADSDTVVLLTVALR